MKKHFVLRMLFLVTVALSLAQTLAQQATDGSLDPAAASAPSDAVKDTPAAAASASASSGAATPTTTPPAAAASASKDTPTPTPKPITPTVTPKKDSSSASSDGKTPSKTTPTPTPTPVTPAPAAATPPPPATTTPAPDGAAPALLDGSESNTVYGTLSPSASAAAGSGSNGGSNSTGAWLVPAIIGAVLVAAVLFVFVYLHMRKGSGGRRDDEFVEVPPTRAYSRNASRAHSSHSRGGDNAMAVTPNKAPDESAMGPPMHSRA